MPSYEAQGGDTVARAGFHTSVGVTHKRYHEFSVTDKAAFRHTKRLIVLPRNADSGINKLALH